MARTESLWQLLDSDTIQTVAPGGYDLLINGSNKYINFNELSGATGYGFRDNGGTMQFKNSGGSWTNFGSGGSGSAITLDLGDDGANESTDLSEIATSGDTNSIFTEPTADKLLIDVSQNWPTADDVAKDVEGISTSLTAGSIPFSNGTTLAQDNANLFWDDTNDRLGIGGTTPLAPIHVTKDQAALTEIRLDNSNVSGSMAYTLYDGSNRRGYIEYDTAAALVTIASDIATGKVRFNTGSDAEAMRLDENGNAGIGAASPARRLHSKIDDAANSSVTQLLRLTHTTSGAAAAGIGTGMEFETETASGNDEIGAVIEAVTTDVTAGSEDFDLRLYTMAAGTTAVERLRINDSGLSLNAETGVTPEIKAIGTDTNVSLAITAKGTGNIVLTNTNTADSAVLIGKTSSDSGGLTSLEVEGSMLLGGAGLLAGAQDGGVIYDINANEVLVLGSVSSAVNELKIDNAATGNNPTIAASGSDTNIGLNLTPKGTGSIVLGGNLATGGNDILDAGQITVGSSTQGSQIATFIDADVAPNSLSIGNNSQAVSVQGSGSAYFHGMDYTNSIEFLMGTSSSGFSFIGSITNHKTQLRANNSAVADFNTDLSVLLYGNLNLDGNNLTNGGNVAYTTATGTVSALGNLGATEAIDWSAATHFTGTLDSDVTISHTNETSGKKITLALAYDGTAQRTITWSDVDKWEGGAEPTTPSATGEELVVTLIFLGTTCYGSGALFS